MMYYEDDDREEEEEYDTPVSGGRERCNEPSGRASSFDARLPQYPGNKVVNIHATAQLQVVLFKPEHFGEETRACGG